VCELLKTVSLLKSDITNDKTKHKKLVTTKKNCKKVNDKILVSNTLEFLKFIAEK
jgi:predicted nicotinamide N-methyase